MLSSHADLRLLRLAKTLRSIWSPPRAIRDEAEAQVAGPAGRDGAQGASSMSSLVGKEELWNVLSCKLAGLESQLTSGAKPSPTLSSISPALSRLQPLVEAFFLVHAPINSASNPAGPSVSAGPAGPAGSPGPAGSAGPARSRTWSESAGADAGSVESPSSAVSRGRSLGGGDGGGPVEAWMEFAEKHRKALNAYIRQVVDCCRRWLLHCTLLTESLWSAGQVASPTVVDPGLFSDPSEALRFR